MYVEWGGGKDKAGGANPHLPATCHWREVTMPRGRWSCNLPRYTRSWLWVLELGEANVPNM